MPGTELLTDQDGLEALAARMPAEGYTSDRLRIRLRDGTHLQIDPDDDGLRVTHE